MLEPGDFIQLRTQTRSKGAYYARCQVTSVGLKTLTIEYIEKVKQDETSRKCVGVKIKESIAMADIVYIRKYRG